MNATLPPTPERAEQAIASLSPAQMRTFLSILCSSHYALIIDVARAAREYGQRRRETKP